MAASPKENAMREFDSALCRCTSGGGRECGNGAPIVEMSLHRRICGEIDLRRRNEATHKLGVTT